MKLTEDLSNVDRFSDVDLEVLISEGLRDHDLSEAKSLYPGEDVNKLLTESVKSSVELLSLIDDDGKCLGLLGITGCDRPGYCVWMVGTSQLDHLHYKKRLLKQAKVLVPRLLSKYMRLSNYCSNHPDQVRWLEYLGFTHKKLTTSVGYFEQCV